MTEPARKSIRGEAPVSPEPVCCDASRHATADRQFRILERLAGFAVVHIAQWLACEQTREPDRHPGFARPPFPLPAESSAPWRLAGPRRESPAPNSRRRKPRRKFSWLQSLENTRNGVGIDQLLPQSEARPKLQKKAPNTLKMFDAEMKSLLAFGHLKST